jgi:hypothetical protein
LSGDGLGIKARVLAQGMWFSYVPAMTGMAHQYHSPAKQSAGEKVIKEDKTTAK